MFARNFFTTCLHSTFSFMIITHLCMLVTEKIIFPIALHTHLERNHAFFFFSHCSMPSSQHSSWHKADAQLIFVQLPKKKAPPQKNNQ